MKQNKTKQNEIIVQPEINQIHQKYKSIHFLLFRVQHQPLFVIA